MLIVSVSRCKGYFFSSDGNLEMRCRTGWLKGNPLVYQGTLLRECFLFQVYVCFDFFLSFFVWFTYKVADQYFVWFTVGERSDTVWKLALCPADFTKQRKYKFFTRFVLQCDPYVPWLLLA